jgi:hypothetical protein
MIKKKITSYEPKKNNSFIVEFPTEFDIPSFAVNRITNPKHINGEWADIHIVFCDPIYPSTTLGLYKLIKYNQNFIIKIKSLDPIGTNVETWIITVGNTFKIDFGNLDYSNDELQTIKMDLTPINCQLESSCFLESK